MIQTCKPNNIKRLLITRVTKNWCCFVATENKVGAALLAKTTIIAQCTIQYIIIDYKEEKVGVRPK